MTTPSPQHVTQLLVSWSSGDRAALDELAPLVYEELRRLAKTYMKREQQGHTLQTTALVNEAYVRLIDWRNVQWQNRAHFFAVAAQMMRRILVDYARQRHELKHGGAVVKMSLEEAAIVPQERDADLVALDDTLQSLAKIDPRKSQIVELRFFGGLSVEETVEVLKVSPRTVMSEWSLAQAWLYRELQSRQER